jgi:tRNA-binding EMAP/Myf-like protein
MPTACACARSTWGRAPAQHRLRRAQCARGHQGALRLVGAELPPGDDGKPFLIKVGKLRGVESQGMLCSARELKLSEDHGGLLELAADAPWARTSVRSC